ncbi:hypothetical protein SD1617_5926 [Shigella dysenteriae 1617]|nr:hypothetical protein SD1617_5926 [Shigella dysenteriae 1617]
MVVELKTWSRSSPLTRMILKTAQIIKDDFFGSDPADARATKG